MGNKCLSKDQTYADGSHAERKGSKSRTGSRKGSIKKIQGQMDNMQDVMDANGIPSSVDTNTLAKIEAKPDLASKHISQMIAHEQ